MDIRTLMPKRLDLSSQCFGLPQRSGTMTMLPVFGPDNKEKFSSPLSGLKLSRVKGYGNVEVENPSGGGGTAIVPLHMGYIQHKAQNHALCRSAFIAVGQKLMFTDACCVQSGQGGYLVGQEQWFFILPLQLRREALRLRGQKSYSKLWPAIKNLNKQFKLAERGHLEQIICRQRAYLTQYQSRFELLPGQTGALFFLGDKLAGLEIAPGAAYFKEVWMPLVCFCYGTAAMYLETVVKRHEQEAVPFEAHNLVELKEQLEASRQEVQEQVAAALEKTPSEDFTIQEEERLLDLRLYTLTGKNFSGQFAEDDGQLVYASLAAHPEYVYSGA